MAGFSNIPTPEQLVSLYRLGIFPMADSESGAIALFSPDPRTIIPLDGFHVSKTLAHAIRSERFKVTFDKDFAGVMAACGARKPTWLSPELAALYQALFERGDAHSVEAWKDGKLAGGSYGVCLGTAFMAESMFHTETNAGMVALAALIERLRGRGFELFDVQYTTPHLKRCGAVEIPRAEYAARVAEAAAKPSAW